MTQFERMKKQDEEFWDNVDQLVANLVPIIGVTRDRQFLNSGMPKQSRIITTSVPGRSDIVSNIYSFFSHSPEFCIPFPKYVIDISQTTPILFQKRELLMKLRNISNTNYTTALCRAIDPYFIGGDDSDWDKKAVEKISLGKDLLNHTKFLLRVVYQKWIQYIKRHSNLDQAKNPYAQFCLLCNCLDAMRNHDFQTQVIPSYILCTSLTLVDNTLCLCGYNGTQSDFPGPVMSKDLLDWLAKYYGFYPKHYSLLKDALRMYQKLQVQEQKKNTTSPPPEFCYLSTQTQYNIYYDKEQKIFTCRSFDSEPTAVGIGRIPIQNLPSPGSSKEFLYDLVGGDWNCLCQLAKIVACCASATKIYKGVVFVPLSTPIEFEVMLDFILGADKPAPRYPVSELTKRKAADHLIAAKISGSKTMVCTNQNSRLSLEQWERFKKLVNGATITYKNDPILGRKMHKSNAQWIIYGNDQTLKKLEAHKIPVLQAPCNCSGPSPTGGASLWLQLVFPLWGYLLLKQSSAPKIDAKPHTVEQFLNSCCTFLEEKGDFLEARVLYNSYLDYCSRHGYQDQLLFKDFNDAVEQYYGRPRERYHRRNYGNKTGFRHIQLNPEETTENVCHSQGDTSKDAFFYQLDQIQEEVLRHFPNFPFQKFLEKNG